MSHFHYLAITPLGQPQRGNLQAIDRAEALGRLRSRGWIVVQLRSHQAEGHDGQDLQPGLARRERILFFLQLSLLLSSGLDIIKALSVVGGVGSSPGLHWTCQVLIFQLERKGLSLSSAMKLLPHSFSPILVGLVRIGEETGGFVQIMADLSVRLEKADRVRSLLLQALIYPAFLCLATGLLMVVLMAVLVPQVTVIVARAGQPLPLLTQVLLWLCSPVALKGFLGLLLVLVVSVLVLAQRQDAGDVWDRFTDHLGLLSALKNQARCAGLCSELAFLIGHGVTLDRSLQLLRGQVSAQSRWGGVIAHIQQTLHQEGDIGQALDHPLLPSVVAQMAQVGSETGRLQQSLAYCAQWLEEGLEMEVDRLLQLLEPLLIAGCGMASGIVCVAAFLPIYGLLNGAQGQ